MLTTDERIKEIDLLHSSLREMYRSKDVTFLLALVKVQRKALEEIVRDGDYSAPEGMTSIAKAALNWKSEDV